MDGDQNEINNVETKNCINCGTLNKKTNNFCMKCGAPMIENSLSPQEKQKNLLMILMILLGFASFALCYYVNGAIGSVIVFSVASLFNKKTRAYGITVAYTYVVSKVLVVLYIIIMLLLLTSGYGN